MQITLYLMTLMAAMTAAAPIVISPIPMAARDIVEARDTEDAVAKRNPIFPNSLRSTDFPRDAIDEYNKRDANNAQGGANAGNHFKRVANNPQGGSNAGSHFKRDANNAQGGSNAGNHF